MLMIDANEAFYLGPISIDVCFYYYLFFQVCIKNARGLPPALSHFVFCQYSFWGDPELTVVAPIVGPGEDALQKKWESGMSFMFEHSNVSKTDILH